MENVNNLYNTLMTEQSTLQHQMKNQTDEKQNKKLEKDLTVIIALMRSLNKYAIYKSKQMV